MGDSGGTTELTLTCPRDSTPTRLRCAECESPICPECYVRTPVGLRCPDCAAASVPPPAAYAATPRRRWVVPAAVAGVLAVVLAAVVLVSTRGGGAPAVSDEWPQGGVFAEPVRLGSGTLPRGGWVLDGRRGEGICVTLTLVPGATTRERCYPPPGDRGISATSTSRLGTPAETLYLTLGVVSDRTERVLVGPEGQDPWEVPALGAGANLGGRVFVAHTTSPVAVFTALAADGSELGRIRSAPPGT